MKKNGAEHWHELYLDSNLANASSERSLDLNDQAAALQSTNQLKSLLPVWNGEKKKIIYLQNVCDANKCEELV